MIAATAGVGKATIHRRYPTKRELGAAALRAAAGEFVAPRTGLVMDDLAALIYQMSGGTNSRPLGRLLAAMSFAEPELLELVWTSFGQPYRAVLEEVVIAAIADGQLRPDLFVELFVDILCSVPIWTQLVRPAADFTVESAQANASLLLAGARPGN